MAMYVQLYFRAFRVFRGWVLSLLTKLGSRIKIGTADIGLCLYSYETAG